MSELEPGHIDSLVPNNWTHELAAVIEAAMREFYPQLSDIPVALFTISCFPWHGFVELSILTSKEADVDPDLNEPAEMAAWQYYNFAANLAAWHRAEVLERQMKDTYYAAPDADRGAIADAFFKACAIAAASPEVERAVELLKADNRFRISVSHPDDGREFYRSRRGTR